MIKENLYLFQFLIGALLLSVLGRYVVSATSSIDKSLKPILIQKLFENSPLIIISGFVVSVFIAMGLWNDVDHESIIMWLTAIGLVTMARTSLLFVWKRYPTILKSRQWGDIFCIGAFLSGSLFASLLTFYDPTLPYTIQLLLMVMLTGILLGAMPSNAIYLPSYYSFSFPIVIALFYWSLNQGTEYSVTLTGLTLAYALVLHGVSRFFNRNLCNAITIQQSNAKLIEDLSRSNYKLEQMTYIDTLTGLSNRNTFHTNAIKLCSRAITDRMSMAILRIDFDNLGKINNHLGEAGGDYLLIQTASRLKNCLGQKDNFNLSQESECARFGGDEFIALLTGPIKPRDLDEICKRTLHNLTQPLIYNGHTVIPSLSMGVSIMKSGDNCIEKLLILSNEALSQVKLSGKNDFNIHIE
ncbi:MAG: GGDEF domain-containing protein [Candidatus Sedimenticola sp. 20ELBAFRAG]